MTNSAQKDSITMIRTKEPKPRRIQKALFALDAVKAERCRRSFYYFMREFWDCISAETPRWNWHIEYLTSQLQQLAMHVAQGLSKEHDMIINIPPGSTKSITCTIMFPVWCWLNWHWMRFIVGSYSGALSLEHAETSRDLIRSDKFQRLFPYLKIKQDKDTKSNFKITKILPNGDVEIGGNRYSTSVGGTLTGFHAHILIVDDPLDPNRAASEVEINKANRWISQTLSTRKVDKEITPMILIMQRLHENDPTGYLLARKSNIFHICIPGEIRTEGFKEKVAPKDLISKYKDGLMDPVRLSWQVLQDMQEDLGQYGYAGQVGQNPVPPGGGMFKVDHFQVVDKMPAPVNIERVVRYWDKAGTEGGGAYTVGVKLAKLKSKKWIVVDVKRGQWATEEREAIIRETAEADGKEVTIYIEQEPGSGGKESLEASIRNLAGFTVYGDRPSGDKVYRADPWSVQVNNGNVYLLKGEWNHKYIEEHRYFPYGTYKDQVDASSGAFSKLALRKVVKVIG